MSVRITGISWLGILIMSVVGCQSNDLDYNTRYKPFTQKFAESTGYDLLQPSKTFLLPDALTEISGLSTLNDSTLACVQDESGLIFLYSLNQERVTEKLKFAGSGDYEGIEVVGNDIYVLKNTGKLYQYSMLDKTTKTLNTPLKGVNNAEGLTYNPETEELLIVCKGKAGLNGEAVEGKAIYSYHTNGGFKPEPLYLITAADLVSWNDQQTVPFRLSERRKAFMPSGVAIHPQTGDIYIIASAGKLLIVIGKSGQIKHGVPLSPKVFRQPEGICFTSTGDLIISNEGQDGNAKIQFFKVNQLLKDPRMIE